MESKQGRRGRKSTHHPGTAHDSVSIAHVSQKELPQLTSGAAGQGPACMDPLLQPPCRPPSLEGPHHPLGPVHVALKDGGLREHDAGQAEPARPGAGRGKAAACYFLRRGAGRSRCLGGQQPTTVAWPLLPATLPLLPPADLLKLNTCASNPCWCLGPAGSLVPGHNEIELMHQRQQVLQRVVQDSGELEAAARGRRAGRQAGTVGPVGWHAALPGWHWYRHVRCQVVSARCTCGGRGSRQTHRGCASGRESNERNRPHRACTSCCASTSACHPAQSASIPHLTPRKSKHAHLCTVVPR